MFDTKQVTVTEPIEFETILRPTADLFIGDSEVGRLGQNGSKNVLYAVTFQDGREVARFKRSEDIIVPATPQIELVGTKSRVE